MTQNEMTKKWQIMNSLWILFSFIPFFNWAGFLLISILAKELKWRIYSLIYLLICFISPLLFYEYTPIGSISEGIIICSWIIIWSVSIIHSFLCRDEYVNKRFVIVNNRNTISNLNYTRTIQRNEPNIKREKININTCSEKELMLLPGISVALAKKSIMIRKREGPFSCVDAFINKLDLMPHFATQIRELTYVTPIEDDNGKDGRQIDF